MACLAQQNANTIQIICICISPEAALQMYITVVRLCIFRNVKVGLLISTSSQQLIEEILNTNILIGTAKEVASLISFGSINNIDLLVFDDGHITTTTEVIKQAIISLKCQVVAISSMFTTKSLKKCCHSLNTAKVIDLSANNDFGMTNLVYTTTEGSKLATLVHLVSKLNCSGQPVIVFCNVSLLHDYNIIFICFIC